LGGLPPFLGFFPKWVVIEYLISINYLFLLFLLIYFTLVTLYFYLRISYTSFLLNYNEMNWNFNNYFNNNNFYLLSFFLYTNIFGLIFINLFFFIF
jgi:NADH-ubiquinone oxidoreductase chain 2